jgi:hypothetical protein
MKFMPQEDQEDIRDLEYSLQMVELFIFLSVQNFKQEQHTLIKYKFVFST